MPVRKFGDEGKMCPRHCIDVSLNETTGLPASLLLDEAQGGRGTVLDGWQSPQEFIVNIFHTAWRGFLFFS